MTAERDNLRHENLKLKFELSGMYAKYDLLRGAEGDREQPGDSFLSTKINPPNDGNGK